MGDLIDPKLESSRLPYHSKLDERFGIDRGQWTALVESVFPTAKSPEAVIMALSYCSARKLDIFKKPVHIVPMWDSAKRDYVETVWPSINEVRTTAFRTKQYAGCNEAEFGEDITLTFSGRTKEGNSWVDKEVTLTVPEWCRITVCRLDATGTPRNYVGPKTYWKESYATSGKSELPNQMWSKRSRGQLEKCAEAAALRKAFPEEVGDMITAEEMEGQVILDGKSEPQDKPNQLSAPPPPPDYEKQDANDNGTDTAPPPPTKEKPAEPESEKAASEPDETQSDEPNEEIEAQDTADGEKPSDDKKPDLKAMFDEFEGKAAKAKSLEDLEEIWDEFDFGPTLEGDDISMEIVKGIKTKNERRINRDS